MMEPEAGPRKASPPRRRAAPRRPRLTRERALWGAGHLVVAGVDEVGRGAWAGPLTVGVAVVPATVTRLPRGLRDSKMLAEAERERLFGPLTRWCAAWAVGHAGPEECDALGMTAALRLAARRAFSALGPGPLPDAVVLDGNFDFVSPPDEPTLFDRPDPFGPDPGSVATGGADPWPGWRPAVTTVVKGDATCASVAAASVLAKVTRDRLMRDAAEHYPPFDFHRNKGYPSPAHRMALRGYGLTAVHRSSWAFVTDLPWTGGAPGCRVGDGDPEGEEQSGLEPDVEADLEAGLEGGLDTEAGLDAELDAGFDVGLEGELESGLEGELESDLEDELESDLEEMGAG